MSFDPHAQRPGRAHQGASVAEGIELAAPGTLAVSGTVSVAEAGRLLRCSEATVRRLIRTTVLRRVGVGEHHVRRSDVESYRQSLLRPRREHLATAVW
jgi:excisionase family DNA binding protein